MIVIPLDITFGNLKGPDIVYIPISRRWGRTNRLIGDWEYEPLESIPTDIEPVSFKAFRSVRRIANKREETKSEWKSGDVCYFYAIVDPPFVGIDHRFLREELDNILMWKNPTLDMARTGLYSNGDYRLINGKTWVHVLNWEMHPDSPNDTGMRTMWNRRIRPMPPGSQLYMGKIDFTYVLDAGTFCIQRLSFDFDFEEDEYTFRTGWKTYHFGRGRGVGIHPVRKVTNSPKPSTIGIDPYKTGRYEETVEKQNRLLSWILK